MCSEEVEKPRSLPRRLALFVCLVPSCWGSSTVSTTTSSSVIMPSDGSVLFFFFFFPNSDLRVLSLNRAVCFVYTCCGFKLGPVVCVK